MQQIFEKRSPLNLAVHHGILMLECERKICHIVCVKGCCKVKFFSTGLKLWWLFAIVNNSSGNRKCT